jgi:hypothetical protein
MTILVVNCYGERIVGEVDEEKIRKQSSFTITNAFELTKMMAQMPEGIANIAIFDHVPDVFVNTYCTCRKPKKEEEDEYRKKRAELAGLETPSIDNILKFSR